MPRYVCRNGRIVQVVPKGQKGPHATKGFVVAPNANAARAKFQEKGRCGYKKPAKKGRKKAKASGARKSRATYPKGTQCTRPEKGCVRWRMYKGQMIRAKSGRGAVLAKNAEDAFRKWCIKYKKSKVCGQYRSVMSGPQPTYGGSSRRAAASSSADDKYTRWAKAGGQYSAPNTGPSSRRTAAASSTDDKYTRWAKAGGQYSAPTTGASGPRGPVSSGALIPANLDYAAYYDID